jgi:hypothetical protein
LLQKPSISRELTTVSTLPNFQCNQSWCTALLFLHFILQFFVALLKLTASWHNQDWLKYRKYSIFYWIMHSKIYSLLLHLDALGMETTNKMHIGQ